VQKGSIAWSLFWLSAAWLILALMATAFLLTQLYYRALDDRLVEDLAGDRGDQLRLANPDYGRPLSGWYWVIRDAEGRWLNNSIGLYTADYDALPEIEEPFDEEGNRSAALRDSGNRKVRVVEQEITLGTGQQLRIMVAGSLDEVDRLVSDFSGQAYSVLVAVGAMLAMMSAIVARIALRPIGRLRAAIEQIREGEAETVGGTFPREIAPLALEVNELLRSNTAIVERARNQVGNLAHGLKTPLAVLRNEARGNPSSLAKVVLSESDKMSSLVSNYLDKARLAARTTVVGKKADPTMIVLRLVRVMEKIHPGTTVAFRRPDASLPWFRGDESDLEEMVGNLLDNACKWANGQVAVTMAADRRQTGVMLMIRIEDNGPGLTEDEAKAVLGRGVRLDEQTPGSGLGLDIVKELVGVYGGGLDLRRSVLGGLLVELRLPAARLGGLKAA
jgi:signal transduction histidine kinase